MVTKVYLDTRIISGMAKQDIAAAEQTALLTILQRQKSGEVGLLPLTWLVAKSTPFRSSTG